MSNVTTVSPPPAYEAGWMVAYDDDRPAGFFAFYRPYSEDWYDLYHFDRWLDAVAKAMEIAKTKRDCLFVGKGAP